MERPSQIGGPARAETPDGCPSLALSFAQTRLKVGDVMNDCVVTASSNESIFSVAQRMCTQGVSCVVVTDEDTPSGIFTERDLLRGIAQAEKHFGRLAVGAHMSHPVRTVSPDAPVLEAGEMLRSHNIKHLPVVLEHGLAGIVTQTDITQGLICLTSLQQVSEIMSRNVATVELETSVADAARIMASRHISCVVVMQWDQPVGVLTQKDILRRVVAFQKDPALTEVCDAMSVPILPIPPHYSVFTASRTMRTMHIHRLVVVDEGTVRGIVSQTDVLNAVHKKLVEEASRQRCVQCFEIPMFVLDSEAVITCVNAACMRFFQTQACEDLVGTSLSDERLWRNAENRQQLLRLLRAEQPGLLELVVETATGTSKRVALLMTTTRNGRDVVSEWKGVIWDP